MTEAETMILREVESLKDEVEFLRSWKDDVVQELCTYDAETIGDVYRLGIERGIRECRETYEGAYKGM